MILAISSSFSCWEFIARHPGLLLVLLGVIGEIVCDWQEMGGRLASAKRLSAILLVVGLLLEFIEASQSDREIAGLALQTQQFRVRADNLESNNLALQIELQRIKSPRDIKPEQREKFMKALGNLPRGPLILATRHPDGETEAYYLLIKSMLKYAGYTFESEINYPANLTPFRLGKDIGILVDKMENAPPYTFTLFSAFVAAGFNVERFVNDPKRQYVWDEGQGTSNKVMILIVEKPPPQ